VFFKISRSVFRRFRVLVQTNPVNRITNLARFFAYVFYQNMRLYPYQTNIRKFTSWQHRWTKILGDFCWLGPPNKASIPNLKCETLEICVVFINPILFCPVIYRQSSTHRCYLENYAWSFLVRLWGNKSVWGLSVKRHHSLLGILNFKLAHMPSLVA